ncbi:hypothetical protein GCM10020221_21070 [Streptomyces thioluteus]|uniref:Uncharacterized protein n=1 Tax=Streptomyces thioluteus TaxID=66431 RepID=A0ABN3WQR6_STRTU
MADLDLHLYPGETVALLAPTAPASPHTLDLLLGPEPPRRQGVVSSSHAAATGRQQGKVGAMLQSGGLMER